MSPGFSRRAFVALTAVASVVRADASGVVTPDDGGYGTGGYGAGPYGDPTREARVADYANARGVVDTAGLRTAIDDWRAGDIDTAFLREVIDAWRSGDPV